MSGLYSSGCKMKATTGGRARKLPVNLPKETRTSSTLGKRKSPHVYIPRNVKEQNRLASADKRTAANRASNKLPVNLPGSPIEKAAGVLVGRHKGYGKGGLNSVEARVPATPGMRWAGTDIKPRSLPKRSVMDRKY